MNKCFSIEYPIKVGGNTYDARYLGYNLKAKVTSNTRTSILLSAGSKIKLIDTVDGYIEYNNQNSGKECRITEDNANIAIVNAEGATMLVDLANAKVFSSHDVMHVTDRFEDCYIFNDNPNLEKINFFIRLRKDMLDKKAEDFIPLATIKYIMAGKTNNIEQIDIDVSKLKNIETLRISNLSDVRLVGNVASTNSRLVHLETWKDNHLVIDIDKMHSFYNLSYLTIGGPYAETNGSIDDYIAAVVESDKRDITSYPRLQIGSPGVDKNGKLPTFHGTRMPMYSEGENNTLFVQLANNGTAKVYITNNDAPKENDTTYQGIYTKGTGWTYKS